MSGYTALNQWLNNLTTADIRETFGEIDEGMTYYQEIVDDPERLQAFDLWFAEEIRKAKAEARVEALTKARAWINRIYPAGLIAKKAVLADLEEWADRAKRGVQPNGHPYTEES